MSDKHEQALRYNEGKAQWHLVDFKSLEPLVRVLEYGAKKYAPNNWKKGAPKEQYLDCIMRHLVEVMDGNELDAESKQHHMGHIMANAMFYIYVHRQEAKPSIEVICPDCASRNVRNTPERWKCFDCGFEF